MTTLDVPLLMPAGHVPDEDSGQSHRNQSAQDRMALVLGEGDPYQGPGDAETGDDPAEVGDRSMAHDRVSLILLESSG